MFACDMDWSYQRSPLVILFPLTALPIAWRPVSDSSSHGSDLLGPQERIFSVSPNPYRKTLPGPKAPLPARATCEVGPAPYNDSTRRNLLAAESPCVVWVELVSVFDMSNLSYPMQGFPPASLLPVSIYFSRSAGGRGVWPQWCQHKGGLPVLRSFRRSDGSPVFGCLGFLTWKL